VVEGFRENKEDKMNCDLTLINSRLRSMRDMKVSLSDAVRETVQEFDLPKKKIYRRALEIWNGQG